MYIHANSHGGVSVGGSLSDFFGFGRNSFMLGNQYIYLPKTNSYHMVHYNSVAELQNGVRKSNMKDGLQLALYGTAAIALGINVIKSDDPSVQLATGMGAAICSVYAIDAGIHIKDRNAYLREVLLKEASKKTQEATLKEKKEG